MDSLYECVGCTVLAVILLSGVCAELYTMGFVARVLNVPHGIDFILTVSGLGARANQPAVSADMSAKQAPCLLSQCHEGHP